MTPLDSSPENTPENNPGRPHPASPGETAALPPSDMTLKRRARIALERFESWFDAAFSPQWNPLCQLGALGYFFFWIVLGTGVYLFIFFDTGIKNAYESLESITYTQWYAGGVMRSLHRYASDALVMVMLLHMIREFIMDRYRGARWFSWFTGVPILWFVYISGISGYWLVWDLLAQYVAIATTQLFDAFPIFGQSIARNFLNDLTLSDRFFTLMIFVHIIVPLFLLLAMWIHLQRLSRARVNPPLGLGAGIFATLLVVSFANPAVSQARVDLSQVPSVVNLDWFYLALYPLIDELPGLEIWGILWGVSILLILTPWLPVRRRKAAAVVDPAHCNGCGRCVADCPFNAVMLGRRTDNHPAYRHQAHVEAALCESCGICVGSCPSSTPFRKIEDLVTGIDLPEFPLRELKSLTEKATQGLKGKDKILVYGCSVFSDDPGQENTGFVRIPCVSMLPPSFIDYVLSKNLADGILITGCREGACHQRLGIAWMEQRIAGQRDPYLRERVPRKRLRMAWIGGGGQKALEKELAEFRTDLNRGNGDS